MATVVLNFVTIQRLRISQINYLRKCSPSNVTDLPRKCYKVKCRGIVRVTDVVSCTGKYLKTIFKLRGKICRILQTII